MVIEHQVKQSKVSDVINLDVLPQIGPKRNTAVNGSKIEYVELNANPILGCSHACRYCYARKLDLRFGNVKSNADWHKPKFYVNYFEVFQKELDKNRINN
jgi:DNA repair photolyase